MISWRIFSRETRWNFPGRNVFWVRSERKATVVSKFVFVAGLFEKNSVEWKMLTLFVCVSFCEDFYFTESFWFEQIERNRWELDDKLEQRRESSSIELKIERDFSRGRVRCFACFYWISARIGVAWLLGFDLKLKTKRISVRVRRKEKEKFVRFVFRASIGRTISVSTRHNENASIFVFRRWPTELVGFSWCFSFLVRLEKFFFVCLEKYWKPGFCCACFLSWLLFSLCLRSFCCVDRSLKNKYSCCFRFDQILAMNKKNVVFSLFCVDFSLTKVFLFFGTDEFERRSYFLFFNVEPIVLFSFWDE